MLVPESGSGSRQHDRAARINGPRV